MAGPKTFDRTRETTAVTGTGAATLLGAASGYRAFSAVLSDTDTCLYAIVEQSGSDWECGLGTFASGANTLTRTTVLASSNAGAAVNFGVSTKDVWIDQPAAMLTYFNPTAAFASLAAVQQGRIGFPNNGFNLYRDSGSLLVPWGPIFPLTEPVSGDFAWINQGGASVTTTNGGIFLADPTNASLGLRIRKKAAPATPYTITVNLLTHLPNIASISGICFRESGSGKLHAHFINVLNPGTGGTPAQASPAVIIGKLDSATSYNADYFRNFMIPPTFLRIADDGANRISSVSWDGQNWTALHTVGRADFLTADEVGFFTASANATNGSGLTLLSWKEA